MVHLAHPRSSLYTLQLTKLWWKLIEIKTIQNIATWSFDDNSCIFSLIRLNVGWKPHRDQSKWVPSSDFNLFGRTRSIIDRFLCKSHKVLVYYMKNVYSSCSKSRIMTIATWKYGIIMANESRELRGKREWLKIMIRAVITGVSLDGRHIS